MRESVHAHEREEERERAREKERETPVCQISSLRATKEINVLVQCIERCSGTAAVKILIHYSY